ncbi:hypothetical protein R6Q59_010039 [Mikania micrantha]
MTYGRRDVWLAGFAAFIAWGLAVQRLPILRFIGYAFNLGLFSALALILAATFLVTRPLPPQASSTHRILPAFVKPSIWKSEITRYSRAQEYNAVQLYPESFVVSQALDGIVNFILRDFVASWYTHISQSPHFVNELDKNIRVALVNIRDRMSKQDLPSFVISKIVPILKNHLKDFDQAERAVRGKTLNRSMTESEELDLAIAAKYKDGKLHPAASMSFSDTKGIQQDHIRKTIIRILPEILPEQLIGSRAVSVLVKEIVSCAVLFPVLQMLAEPDTWNQIIEAYGRKTLQDRKTVKRMRAALDQHATPVANRGAPAGLPRLSPNDSERAFERFVRAIRKTKNLADARRFRSQLASQLAKENTIEGQDAVFLRRLEMGKRVLEQKIAKLTTGEKVPLVPVTPSDNRGGKVSKARELPLVEIMHTASGLSYFMEFMDRRQRMSLVQFWIVVDGFRNPLEDDFGDDNITGFNTWTPTDRMDIAQMSETYISKPELKVPSESQENIRKFLVAGKGATQEEYRTARTAILTAQSAVLEELETSHFPQFKKSDLYYKFLASDEASAKGLNASDEPESSAIAALTKNMNAPSMTRSSSQPSFRPKDLRRAALSSSDVKSLASVKFNETTRSSRRSHDITDRPPLFDDGSDTDPLAHSAVSVGSEPLFGEATESNRVIENMEAALTDIIASPTKDLFGEEGSGLFGPVDTIQPSVQTLKLQEPPRSSTETPRIDTVLTERARPSIATLGLVNTSSRIGVFTDNDLFPDEERFAEDEYADPEPEHDDVSDPDIHEAAPGDLGLTEAIKALSMDIERLVSQESIVDTLTRKAELTNNVAELRILGKSKSSLQREIRRKELQRQQYIVQESDNSLFGRSDIRITSVMVGREEDGREYAVYVIEVQRQAADQMPSAIWAISRRYSEFHDLHQRLRRRYPSTRNLEFPRRRMVMKLQKHFLHSRRVALEAYLQQLLRMPDVCRSRELRSFLSQSAIITENQLNSPSDTQDLVTRIYNSVTDGMDEFLGNIAVLDQLSSAGQNLISAATGQAAIPTHQQSSLNLIPAEPGSIAEAEAELRAFEDKELEPFVKPICDIFLEIFELNRGNNWLRGRAVVVVLHQLLGGTVERKIRDSFRGLFAEGSLLAYIDTLKQSMWPDGGPMKQSSRPRTPAERSKSQAEAAVMLATLVPDLVGSVVGRANAQVAARRIMATMNNRRLNEHLVMCIFDEIVALLFDIPDVRVYK